MHPLTAGKIHFFRSLAIVVLAAIVQGCAVWDFVEVRWQNATGFFNTYYNARKLFNEAEEEIAESQFRKSIDPQKVSISAGEDIVAGKTAEDRNKIMRDIQLIESGAPSTAIQKLDRVIEKCSRLIVSYPKSKWVDNALVLIGKSYFYKLELTRAERKFQELLDRYPDSDLRTEAILWLGKTYVRLDKYDVAKDMFDRAIQDAIKEGDADISASAYYEMGKMYLLSNRQSDAIEAFRNASSFDADKRLRIQVQLSLAREYERLGDKERAAQAYRDIFQLEPTTDLAFVAELNYAKLSRETGDLDEAGNTLIDMLDNPMYLEWDSKIQLEIGNLYLAYFRHYRGVDDTLSNDAFNAALDQYTLVDTTFKGTAEAADALYAKGQLYENDLRDYDNAFDKYNAAKLAFPGTESAQLGGKKATIFGDYRKLRRKLYDADTTLYFVRNPDSLRVRDSLQVIADSLDRMKRLAEGDESSMTEEQKFAERFRRRRPHGRNTGKINPWLMEKQKTQQATASGMQNTEQAVLAAGPTYRRVNLSALNQDSLRTSVSILQMEMGWHMFDKIGNVDSARWYYLRALDNGLPDTMKAQALYTMAAIMRKLNDESEALRFEDRLVAEFPRNRYAASVMHSRGIQPPKDSTLLAREAYDAAAEFLERGDTARGLAALRKLIEAWSQSEQALRARLAIAMVLEEKHGDEALAMYRDMVANHANSPYSKRGKEILAALEQAEKDKETRQARDAERAKQKAAEEEERKKREMRERNPLLDTELKVLRDSARTTTPNIDPSRDEDFPLRLPGEEPEKKTPEAPPPDAAPINADPRRQPGRIPGDTLRTLTPKTVDPR